jgi:predicted hotdog family 3-hydroxylacyl-ACP dehydratase
MPLDAASVKAGFVAGQRSMLAAIEREHEAFKVELQETQRQLGAVTAVLHELRAAMNERNTARVDLVRPYRERAIERA